MRPSRFLQAAILFLAFAAQVLAAENNPFPIVDPGDNPALVRFGRSVVFYVSFDGHANAEITRGDPKPSGNAEWQAAAKDPQKLFVPGLVGQALRSGTRQLIFTCSKPVLGTTGTMALWLKPESLHHRGTYCWPAILDALEGGYRVMFGRMGNKVNGEMLYAHLAHGKTNVTAIQGSMTDWKPGVWRLLVVGWDRTGVELSIDGAQPSRANLTVPIDRDASGGLRLSLLGQNEDQFLYDEFLVLDVRLTPDEIRWLYNRGAK